MKKIGVISIICLFMLTCVKVSAVEKPVDNSPGCQVIKFKEDIRKVEDETIKGELKYPYLIDEKSEFIDNINKELNNDIEAWIADLKDLSVKYKEDMKKNNISEIRPFEVASDYKITLNRCQYLSYYIDFYQYTGGAHGITTRKTYNFNIKDKKSIELKDLFVQGYDYKKVINNEIARQIQKDKDNFFEEGKAFKGISDNQRFTIGQKGIDIYFQLYDIAPYVYGIPTFNISYELLKDGLK